MPCYVSVDLFYAVSPCSFLFPYFVFVNVVPVFLVLNVHCWPSYFVFLSLPYLTPPPSPSSDWAMRGGCGLWGRVDTSDPSPVIGRRHLFVTLHNQSQTPTSTHADVVKKKMTQIFPTISLWSRPYLDAHLTSFALGAVCGRPKWRSKAPAQTLPLKTWKTFRPWTPSAPAASVCPSMLCAGRAILVTSKPQQPVIIIPAFPFFLKILYAGTVGGAWAFGAGRCLGDCGVGVDIWFELILKRVHAGGGFCLLLSVFIGGKHWMHACANALRLTCICFDSDLTPFMHLLIPCFIVCCMWWSLFDVSFFYCQKNTQ